MNIADQQAHKHRMRLFWATALIFLFVLTINEVGVNWQQFIQATGEFQEIEDELKDVKTTLNNLNVTKTKEAFTLTSQTAIYSEDLDQAEKLFCSVKDNVSELREETPKEKMRTIYDETVEDFNLAVQLIENAEVETVKESGEQVSDYVIAVCNQEIAKLKKITSLLDNWQYKRFKSLDIYSLYKRVLELCTMATAIREETDKQSNHIEEAVNILQDQSASMTRLSEPLDKQLDSILTDIEEYEAEEAVKQSVREKLENLGAESEIDVSVPIGFTEEEFHYILQKSGLIKDERVVEVLPEVMVKTVKEYSVNELVSLSVMSLESGFFSSYLARENNNFGGMLGFDDKGLVFNTVEQGLTAAIKCLHNNLVGNCTLREINESYCPPATPNDYFWADNVEEIIRMYKGRILD